MDNTLENILKELYAIPNAPFVLKPREEYIKQKIKDAGLSFKETPYFISAQLTKEKKNIKLFFISHLDHPGFVFKNKKEGIAFGSLYLDQIENLKPLSIYTDEGTFLGDANITKVYGRDQSKTEIDANFDVPINSQGIWNLGDVSSDEKYIYGRSHDNDVATSILLNNLGLVENSDFEIVFVFTKHEEVLQQSSFNIAKNNSLEIKPNDLVINLESMKVIPSTDNPGYSNLNYENGVVLNISETSCIYGKENVQNISESLINNLVYNLNLKIQRGMASGSSDARPISVFRLTNNIVTLNIPNEFKHNVDGENIVLERVKREDVSALDKIIKAILTTTNLKLESNPNDISLKVKQEYLNFNIQSAKQLFRLNTRLDYAFRDVIKRGHYFPESFRDSLKDFYWKITSYVTYFLSKK